MLKNQAPSRRWIGSFCHANFILKAKIRAIIERMEITREEIDHLAQLSDFSLTDEEKDSLGADLKNIIKYISQLSELDTDGIEPTYQVFEMENVWRADEIIPQDATPDALLATAPEVQEHQIKVPKVL